MVIDEMILIVSDLDHENYKNLAQTPLDALPFH